MSSEFEKLAGELEVLAKAQQAASEEDKVLAAAQEAGVDTDGIGLDEGSDDDAGDDAGDAGDGEDDEVLGKSFRVIGVGGQAVKAYDATELIKSLNERVAGLETGLEDVAERREHLGKSLGLITDLIKSQADQIDTLQKAVAELGGQGRGRKTVLNINENPGTALTKSAQPEGLTRPEFMAKADAAFKAGRISGRDFVVAETSLNSGVPVREDIVSRVMAVNQ